MSPKFTECHGDDCDRLDSLLSERIYEFNAAALGRHDGKLFGYAMQNRQGEVMAGASGHTWAGFCYISYLWVSEALRGNGIGRDLVRAVEAEATRRECSIVFVSTHSFQSPEFYERLGYERQATVHDHPVGHSNHVYAKRLSHARGADVASPTRA
jgi:ribosomal protein S18 acetylase RimI-like enzyme